MSLVVTMFDVAKKKKPQGKYSNKSRLLYIGISFTTHFNNVNAVTVICYMLYVLKLRSQSINIQTKHAIVTYFMYTTYMNMT